MVETLMRNYSVSPFRSCGLRMSWIPPLVQGLIRKVRCILHSDFVVWILSKFLSVFEENFLIFVVIWYHR